VVASVASLEETLVRSVDRFNKRVTFTETFSISVMACVTMMDEVSILEEILVRLELVCAVNDTRLDVTLEERFPKSVVTLPDKVKTSAVD